MSVKGDDKKNGHNQPGTGRRRSNDKLTIMDIARLAGARADIWPTLTTVRLPIRHMGRMAAQLPVSNHDAMAMEQSATTSVMPGLIVRGLTCPARM